MQWAHKNGFHFYKADPAHEDKALPEEVRPSDLNNFESDIQTLASLDQSSPAFAETLRKLRPQFIRWFPLDEVPPPSPEWWMYWSRFLISDYRTKGVEYADPAGGFNAWRDKAATFDSHHNFLEDFRGYKPDTQIAIWELIRFYDNTRCDLNSTIPGALGTILLACGLFIQCRLVDWKTPRSLNPKQSLQQRVNNWVPIWERQRTEQESAYYGRPPKNWAR
jgi:hypothetical protein